MKEKMSNTTSNVTERDNINDDDQQQNENTLKDLFHMLKNKHEAENYIKTLPPKVLRRVNALKKIQVEFFQAEAKFFEEIHQLELKYHTEYYNKIFEKREKVITGTYEPTDEEAEFFIPGQDTDDEEAKTIEEMEDVPMRSAKWGETGIPDFWLKVLQASEITSELIQPHDEPILQNLIDVKIIMLDSDKDNTQDMGFVLEFHFKENEYFSNSVLSKEYGMKCKVDPTDPFSFEGPEIYSCRGCKIDWYKGKNVTIKTMKKKQKHKSKQQTRTVTKAVPNDSFFNFFNPPVVPEGADVELDDDTQALITSDFEIGHFIKERMIPKAVLFYTGDIDDDDDYGVEEEEEDEEDEDELEEEEEDEGDVVNPPNKGSAGDASSEDPDTPKNR